ncbi:FAD-binding domain-containing protein [Aspergillus recurvatus]
MRSFTPVALLSSTLTGVSAWVNLTSIYGSGLSPGAEIFYASDPDWDTEVTQRWTLVGAPTFYGAIKPATEQDIQHVVRVSSKRGIRFLAVGAGHGASTTLGRLQDGIEIDLANFNSVNLDRENSLLTVGASVVFSDLFDLLYQSGKMLPMGNAECVGVVGAALGGTIGVFQGPLGLGLDSLVSVRLVTASGDLIEVSKTQHPDLFWGIRGAGANFGIVTSATFRVHDAPNSGNITSIDFLYPGSLNASVWEVLKSFDDDIPSELVLNFAASIDQASGQSVIIANAAYFGPLDEAEELVAPLRALGPLTTATNIVPWTQLQRTAFFGQGNTSDPTECIPGQWSDGYSIGLKQTDVPTLVSFFNSLHEFYSQHPSLNGIVLIERYPNAVTLSVPDGETAYPHREIKIQVLFENYLTNSSLLEVLDEFTQAARAELQKTSGFDELSVYVNFAHGDEGVDAWYTPRKMDNLTRLKRKWDPLEQFSWNCPLPLTY